MVAGAGQEETFVSSGEPAGGAILGQPPLHSHRARRCDEEAVVHEGWR
jgi:hypothetical protein